MKNIFSIISLLLLFISCNKQDLATVKTTIDGTSTLNSIGVKGKIINDGGCAIQSKGICISSKDIPTISDTVYRDASLKLEFKNEFKDLAPGKIYYARAFVVNKVGTAYGEVMKVATLNEITTNTVSGISSTFAFSGGSIKGDLNSIIISKGICWALKSNPTLADFKSLDITNSKTFSSKMIDLLPNSTYYVRAFVENEGGVSYGNEVSFTTKLTSLPNVVTNSVTSITTSSAICSGQVLDDGGYTIFENGICWATSINPTYNYSSHSFYSTPGIGSFDINVSNLQPNTTYFYRAYAINSKGFSYGENKTFTTSPILYPPVVTTYYNGYPYYSIGLTTAKCGGEITSIGSSPIIEKGICYGSTFNPTKTNGFISSGAGGLGTFQADLINLTPNTLYYVRAYAINSQGISYGTCYTFLTTNYSLPVVSTSVASSTTGNSSVAGGNITSDGGSVVTARGVCWSTTSNPNLASNTTTNGLGMGVFTSSISGLTPGTTYYYRAYATNSIGTSYGSILTFTTSSKPILTTNSATSITLNGAITGGNITSDGGDAVTTRGVCWSTTSNPTLASNTTNNGLGIGSFTTTLSSLSPNTTYYVRAYATNGVGTSYGSEISFTTLSLSLPTVTTNSVYGITNSSGTSGGNITSDGGATVTARGVCWSTTLNPTLASNKTNNGLGLGSFTSSITGLTLNTTYYVRAYATNSVGTAYGATVTFKTSINIGDSYGGGIVAYILQSGDPGFVVGQNHGIIAATSDQSSGIRWFNGTYTTTNATGTAIGTGNSNTNTIVSAQGLGSYAAKLCSDLVLGGYSDWYLPSKDELNKLFLSRSIIGGFNSTSLSYYWTSSEYSNVYSHVLQFSTGSFNTGAKGATSMLVRAIRSF